MRKQLLPTVLTGLLSLWSLLAWAQPASAAYAPTAEENSLLWEITGKGMEYPSYLFGTIHLIPAEHFLLTEATKKAFGASQRIAFEIDTEEMSNPMALFPLFSKMMMNNDTTLSDLLTEEEYAAVAAHFDSLGLPLMLLKRVKPMFLTVLASEDIKSFNGKDQGSTKSYELELTELAKTQDKEIIGLETVEFQMSLFDSIPYQAQAQMLLQSIQSEKKDDGTFDRMIDMYKNEDILGMQSMMSDDPAGIGGFEEVLLLRRNRAWIPTIENLMASSSMFIAVGAGHLGGNEGVVALLRAAGYTLRPLRTVDK